MPARLKANPPRVWRPVARSGLSPHQLGSGSPRANQNPPGSLNRPGSLCRAGRWRKGKGESLSISMSMHDQRPSETPPSIEYHNSIIQMAGLPLETLFLSPIVRCCINADHVDLNLLAFVYYPPARCKNKFRFIFQLALFSSASSQIAAVLQVLLRQLKVLACWVFVIQGIF